MLLSNKFFIFFLLFFFIYSTVIAQEINNDISSLDAINGFYELNRSAPQLQPKYRAALFATSMKERWKDDAEKKISIQYMNLLQSEADKYRQEKRYTQAYNRYYEAAVYYPTTLLFFKTAETRIQEFLINKNIYSANLICVLDDYQLGLEFYQYENRMDKSIGENCMKKMQSKIDCFQSLYMKYEKMDIHTVISKDQVLQCMNLGPDIFEYENFCE